MGVALIHSDRRTDMTRVIGTWRTRLNTSASWPSLVAELQIPVWCCCCGKMARILRIVMSRYCVMFLATLKVCATAHGSEMGFLVSVPLFVRLSACISAVTSGRISVKIWHRGLVGKYVEKLRMCLKSDQNIGQCTWIPKFVLFFAVDKFVIKAFLRDTPYQSV
jgi:hypothetical protein